MSLKLLYVCVVVLCVDGHKNHDKQTAPPSALAASPVSSSVSGSFQGSWMETRRGRRIQAYRGIRYAEPPTGKLRFQPPKPILQYKEPVNATTDGPACPSPTRPGYYVDEDCLSVNVYTPENNGSSMTPLPVIVYFHPGGFYSMNGRSDLAGPGYLLDKDLVLVTVNYRLGPLGFMSTGDAVAPGNNGMKDQVAALRWVQRNIRAFGGDPLGVTIAGCSAGSISVMLHMVSPMSRGLFHRAISMSGSPFGKTLMSSELNKLAIRQAEILNCPSNSSQEIMDCLMTKDWKEIVGTLSQFYVFGPGDPLRLWFPVVEVDVGQERFLDEQPLHTILSGRANTVPYIISQTKDEFFWKALPVLRNQTLLDKMNEHWEEIAPISFVLPKENLSTVLKQLKTKYLEDKRLVNDSVSAWNLGRLYGDSIVGFPVHRMVDIISRFSSHPVYYSVFSYIGNNSYHQDRVTGKPTGVAHHDDTLYLFTQPFKFPIINTSSQHSRVVDIMTDVWYNFARYGDPNNRGDTPELSIEWPVYDVTTQHYLDIADTLTLKQRYGEDRFNLWDQLYPKDY